MPTQIQPTQTIPTSQHAQAFAAVLRPDQIVTGAAIKARDPGYCPRSLDCALVLLPESRTDVEAICRVAAQAGIALVPQGGRTGLVHGIATRPGQAALSLERMHKILEIDPDQRLAVVETGVVLQDLIEAAAPYGLMPGFDIPSRGSCQIGGMISTNAGGVRVIRYGMTRQSVLGLEAVLAGGEVLDAMNRLQKNNAGPDLKQMFIGAEGTLGVLTKAVVALVPRPRDTRVALLAVAQFSQLITLLNRARSRFDSQLMSFEVMWPEYYRHTTDQPGYGARPIGPEHAFYAVIEIGFWHEPPAECPLSAFLGEAFEEELLEDAVIAQSQAQAAAIWRAREDGDLIGGHYGACLDYDIGMELSAMEAYVSAMRAQIARQRPGIIAHVYGHMGDGNLHVTIGMPPEALAERAIYDAAVYDNLRGRGPITVSAEHGIGEEKRKVLGLARPPQYLQAIARMKRAFDPQGLMNPGKILADPDPAR